MNAIVIRQATADDRDDLEALIGACYSAVYPGWYSDDILTDAMPAMLRIDPALLASGHYFTASIGGRLAGCGGWSKTAPGTGRPEDATGHIRHFATDPDLMRAARSFGATQRDLFVNVALPGSVPLLVAGMRLGVGRALTGVIVAELFGATAGIGYSISYYGQQLQTTNMFVSLLVIVLMGVILTQLLAALEAKTQGWRVDPNG